MKKKATVLVFRANATEEDIRSMLGPVRRLLDPHHYGTMDPRAKIETFEDDHGYPVFYIP